MQDESGAGSLETALAVVLLLTVVFGIVDGARALYADHFVSNVARDATRYAMVRGATWSGSACGSTSASSCTATTTDISNFVASLTPAGLSASNVTVSATWPGTTPNGMTCSTSNVNNSPGCLVRVKATYNFSFVLPFLPANSLALSSASSVVIAQ